MKIALCFRFAQTFWLSKLSRGAISANNGEEVKGLEEKKSNKQAYPYIQNVATFWYSRTC